MTEFGEPLSNKVELPATPVVEMPEKAPEPDLLQPEKQDAEKLGIELAPKPDFETQIALASDFDGLYSILDQIVGIAGSQKTYNSIELKDIINRVRAHTAPVSAVTGTYGLRAKVIELIHSNPEAVSDIQEKIGTAQSLSELYGAIENNGGLQGSEHFYTAQQITESIKILRMVANRSIVNEPNFYLSITRTAGLRIKVSELFKKEFSEVHNSEQ